MSLFIVDLIVVKYNFIIIDSSFLNPGPIQKETNTFQSTNTGRKYKIKERLECTSDWVIYLITCLKCRGQYIGKSKTIFSEGL